MGKLSVYGLREWKESTISNLYNKLAFNIRVELPTVSANYIIAQLNGIKGKFYIMSFIPH